MAKENLFLKNAKEMGLIDDREIAVVADITCTNGNNGRAWVFINGDQMFLYAMHGLGEIGAHIETLDLNQVQVLKASSFVLHTTMKLTYEGHTYRFQGFAQAKRFIAAVRREG